MDEQDWLAERFEAHRARLRAVAYRMLGSPSEADDAVQEAWLRLGRSGAGVENLGGWLTTVVARVCLNMLRSRGSRREEPLDETPGVPGGVPGGARVPDPIVARADGIDPEQESLWPTRSAWRCSWCSTRSPPPSGSPSCCTTCSGCPSRRSPPSWAAPRPPPGSSPAARAAGFGGPPRSRTPTSPASGRSSTLSGPPRARRLRGAAGGAGPGRRAPRGLRCRGRRSRALRGARAVAGQALAFKRFAPFARPALVNGAPGTVTVPPGADPARGHGLHRGAGQDRRDRHPRGPRAPAPAGPRGGSRGLIRRVSG